VPVLRTDDVVRRQRAIWLGPPGHRWPVDATYVAWGIGFAAAVLLGGSGLAVGVVAGGRTLWPLGILAGAAAAWWVTRSLLKLVDHDRPLRYWRLAWTSERRGEPLVDTQITAEVEWRRS
jgi:hypothetical protein